MGGTRRPARGTAALLVLACAWGSSGRGGAQVVVDLALDPAGSSMRATASFGDGQGSLFDIDPQLLCSLRANLQGTLRVALTEHTIAFPGGSLIEVVDQAGPCEPGGAAAHVGGQVLDAKGDLEAYGAARGVTADVIGLARFLCDLGGQAITECLLGLLQAPRPPGARGVPASSGFSAEDNSIELLAGSVVDGEVTVLSIPMFSGPIPIDGVYASASPSGSLPIGNLLASAGSFDPVLPVALSFTTADPLSGLRLDWTGEGAITASAPLVDLENCPPGPAPGCREPVAEGRSKLTLKAAPVPDRNKLSWKWSRGEATAAADFGDPTAETRYDLCVFDDPGTGFALRANATALPGPGWKATRTGFKFKRKDGFPDGLRSLKLKAGEEGKAKLVAKGKGLGLPGLPLGQGPATVVQLHNTEGQCWEASFSAPAQKSDATRFKDRSDAPS